MADPMQAGGAGGATGSAAGTQGVYMGQLAMMGDSWGTEHQEKTETAIRDAIEQDPLVTDKTNVSVTFGDSKKELHLIGKLSDEKSRTRVREIAVKNTPSDVEIYDEIIVE